MKSIFAGFPTADSEPWVADAVCPKADPDAFFPAAGFKATGAKAVCAECPVRVECLEFALRTGERHGVWGGLSERERSKLKRSGRAA